MPGRNAVGASTTVPCPLREAARSAPEALALQGPVASWSYGALDRCVTATAVRMAEVLGRSEAPVGVYLPNGSSYLVLLWALFRLGRPACVLSTRLPAARVAALLAQTGCTDLLTDRDEVVQAVGEAVRVRHPDEVIARKDAPGLEEAPVLMRTDQPATIVFTSGSTGWPKAALLTFGNQYYNALGANQNIALAPGDRWLLALPLYHVGGLGIVFRCVLAGASVVLPQPGESLGQALAAYEVTHASLVATQLLRLLQADPSPALASLKAVLLGGSVIPAALLAEAIGRGVPLHTTYGMTEMASQVTTTPPGGNLAMLATSGQVLPYRELRIAADGEILVRGQTLCRGYVEDGRVRPAVDADGWFHTKDLGTMGTDGLLRIQGRKDHLFISGGENIQPEAIEAALCQIEGIRRAVVVPVPDDEFGQRPVAFLDAESPFDEEALRQRLTGLLPRFMIPDAFYYWPDLNHGMKIDRRQFQEVARQRRTPL